jgi:hypothetical protein
MDNGFCPLDPLPQLSTVSVWAYWQHMHTHWVLESSKTLDACCCLALLRCWQYTLAAAMVTRPPLAIHPEGRGADGVDAMA